jgi:capsid protein
LLWHPRGFPWVDPLKDMQASLLAVQNGFKTQTDIMAETATTSRKASTRSSMSRIT